MDSARGTEMTPLNLETRKIGSIPSNINQNRLRLCISIQNLSTSASLQAQQEKNKTHIRTKLPPNPRRFLPSKRHLHIHLSPSQPQTHPCRSTNHSTYHSNAIHSTHPCLDPLRNLHCTVQIRRKDPRHETILGIISHINHLILGIKDSNHRYRTKYLLPVYLRPRIRVIKNSRFDKTASIADSISSDQQLSVLLSARNHSRDLFERAAVYQRSVLVFLVLWIANVVHSGFHFGRVALEKIVDDGSVDVHP